MSRINKILNSITFRRILVIFVVGLVSRTLVNLVFDINVFKDYTEFISLTYYVFMACFTGFVQGLPTISLKIFDIKVIISAIKAVCQDNFLVSDKMLSGDKMFSDNMNINKFGENRKDNLVLMQNGESSKVTAGRERRFKSAGVRALYGDPGNRNLVGIPEDRASSFINKIRLSYDKGVNPGPQK
jgi:hypothetical protein